MRPAPDMSTQQRKDKYFGAHEFQAREEVVKTSSDRGFGLMFGVVFGLIAGHRAYRGSTLWPYWLAASGALATVALSVPRVLALPNRLWTTLGLVLFKVVSPVMLALAFYVIVTPIGLLLRLLGKNILGLGSPANRRLSLTNFRLASAEQRQLKAIKMRSIMRDTRTTAKSRILLLSGA